MLADDAEHLVRVHRDDAVQEMMLLSRSRDDAAENGGPVLPKGEPAALNAMAVAHPEREKRESHAWLPRESAPQTLHSRRCNPRRCHVWVLLAGVGVAAKGQR